MKRPSIRAPRPNSEEAAADRYSVVSTIRTSTLSVGRAQAEPWRQDPTTNVRPDCQRDGRHCGRAERHVLERDHRCLAGSRAVREHRRADYRWTDGAYEPA